jgi:hypothetical protein
LTGKHILSKFLPASPRSTTSSHRTSRGTSRSSSLSKSSREGTPENGDVDIRRSRSVIDLLTSDYESGSDSSDVSVSDTPFNFSPSDEVERSWSRSACPSPAPVDFGPWPTKSATPPTLEYEDSTQEDEQTPIDLETRLDWSDIVDLRPENRMVGPRGRSHSVSSYPILDDRSSPLAGQRQDDELLMDEFRSQANEDMYIGHGEVEQEDSTLRLMDSIRPKGIAEDGTHRISIDTATIGKSGLGCHPLIKDFPYLFHNPTFVCGSTYACL